MLICSWRVCRLQQVRDTLGRVFAQDLDKHIVTKGGLGQQVLAVVLPPPSRAIATGSCQEL